MAAYAKLLQAALKANPEGTPLDFSTIRQPEDASEGEAAE